jgi:hypothetical protein
MFHLPGSAREDMAAGCSGDPAGGEARAADVTARLAAIAQQIAAKVKALGASPLRRR